MSVGVVATCLHPTSVPPFSFGGSKTAPPWLFFLSDTGQHLADKKKKKEKKATNGLHATSNMETAAAQPPPDRLALNTTAQPAQNAPVPSRNSLYVGDLDRTVEESLLYQIFSKVTTCLRTQRTPFVCPRTSEERT